MTDAPKGPLADLIVIEMGTLIAGPFCGQILGDFGAEVIKVEDPRVGDPMRQWGRSLPQGLSPWWPVIGRNKKSVGLDLRKPEGQALAKQLIAGADIVIENFRPGAMEKWGLGYEALAKENPRLIMARVSGFGQTGPYSTRGGVDQIAQGLGGLMSITGEPGRGPMRVGIPIDDLTAGNLLAMGVMMALFEREKTGKGRWVHTSLLEAQVFMLDFQATRWLQKGEIAGQAGNDHPVNTPMGVFPSADKPINIAASSPKLWAVFCKAAGREDWLEKPEWKTAEGRTADRAALNAAIGEVTSQKPSEYWIALLEEAGIPCGPINNIREVFEDPQVQHLGMVWDVPHAKLGKAGVVRTPINIEGHRPGIRRGVPGLGEHADEILAEAGLTTEEIAALRAKKVLGE